MRDPMFISMSIFIFFPKTFKYALHDVAKCLLGYQTKAIVKKKIVMRKIIVTVQKAAGCLEIPISTGRVLSSPQQVNSRGACSERSRPISKMSSGDSRQLQIFIQNITWMRVHWPCR